MIQLKKNYKSNKNESMFQIWNWNLPLLESTPIYYK